MQEESLAVLVKSKDVKNWCNMITGAQGVTSIKTTIYEEDGSLIQPLLIKPGQGDQCEIAQG